MEAVRFDRKMDSNLENNQRDIRNMVIDSYQDMLAGAGRNYKEFFAEMESRYKDAKI